MLLLAGLKNQLKQKKTRRIHREKVEQAARHRGRAHRRRQCRGVAVNLEYNDWSGDAVANTQLDSNLYMARLPQDTQV